MKKYLAEFIGTAVLVIVGCGSAMFLGCDADGGHLAVAFAFGLAIVAMAYAIGDISGCHVNPAVSLAMLIVKKLNIKDFIGYIVAQIAGAFAGVGVLAFILTSSTIGDFTNSYGANGFGGVDMWGAVVVEIVLTFIFLLTILGVTSGKPKKITGLVIGFTLTLVHIIGIPLTGTSVNPARSIAPAVIAGGDALSAIWVFIAAPLVGAAIAACIHLVLRGQQTEE